MDFKGAAERRKRLENLRKKRKDEKRCNFSFSFFSIMHLLFNARF